MTSTTDSTILSINTNLITNSLNTTTTLNTNSNDSSHNLSNTSNISCSNNSISTLANLNKVLETQPKSTDSGIGSEKSCTPDNLNKKLPGFKAGDVKKQQHNGVEKKRKDQINIGIRRLSEIIPTVDPIKDSKNKILDKTYNYVKELKDTNQNLILAKTPETQVNEIKNVYQRINELERINNNYLSLLQSAGINPLTTPINQSANDLWNSKPTKYSNKLTNDIINLNPIDTSTPNNKKKNTKKTAANKNQPNNQLNTSTNKPNLSTNTQPMIVMNDQNGQSYQLVSNQNQIVNSQPTANYQFLPNGQLCNTGDSLTTSNLANNLMPGQIIISQPFLNQPTSAIILPNGNFLPIVQNQPNLIYHPNSGLMLTNSVANTSVNNQTPQQSQQTSLASLNQANSLTSTTANTIQLNKLNSNTNFSMNSTTTSSAIINKTTVITNATNNLQQTNLPHIEANTNIINNQTNNNTKSKKSTTPKSNKKNTSKPANKPAEKPAKQTKTSNKKAKKDSKNTSANSSSSDNNKSMKDILATATASIFDFGKMDDMDQMMSDFTEQQQITTAKSNDNLLNKNQMNEVVNSVSKSTSITTSSLPATQQNPVINLENSITLSADKNEPPNKKKKLQEEETISIELTATTNSIVHDIIESNQTSNIHNDEDDDNQTTDIDKILSLSNNNNETTDETHHDEVNFDLIASGEDQLNDVANSSVHTNDNSFLNSLTSSTTDHLNDFLLTSTNDRPKSDLEENKSVDDIFGGSIANLNAANTINSVNQISHSISSLTTDKSNNNNYQQDDKKSIDTFKQHDNQTNLSIKTSSSSYLTYSAESLITNAQQTNQNKQIRSSNYSAESLIHNNNISTTTASSLNTREDTINNKKSTNNNYYNSTMIPQQNDNTNDLISSPVGSHHSSSRPPSNSILSPHNQQTSNHLNRSLNSLTDGLNNSLNKDITSGFPFHNDERHNTSLFTNTMSSNNNTSTTTTTNQQQQKQNSSFNNNQNRNSYNTTADHLLNNAVISTESSNNQQINSSFFTSSTFDSPTSSLNNYQINNDPITANSILPFNYKDSVNTNQTNYQTNLTNNQNKFASTNLFSNSIFSSDSLDTQMNNRKNNKRNQSPNLINKNSSSSSSSNKKSSSSNKSNQLNLQSNPQPPPQQQFDTYSTAAVQNQQLNRQTQFYLDSPLSNNNSTTTRSTDFVSPYFSMPDFSSGSTSNNLTNNTNTQKQITTSSLSAFTNQLNSNQLNDNYFLRPSSNQNNTSNSSTFNLNTPSSNQLQSTSLNQTVVATNRPNFNLSNIIPDIGQSSSSTNVSKSNNNSSGLEFSSRQVNYSQSGYFNTTSGVMEQNQFNSTNMHTFNNILTGSSGNNTSLETSTANQHNTLHHLTTSNHHLHNTSNSPNLASRLNPSSLNNLHNRQLTTQTVNNTINQHQPNDAANLYRSFSSSQFGTNAMNSLNSMPTIGNLSGNLNNQTNNSNLISQNVSTNQSPYVLPFNKSFM